MLDDAQRLDWLQLIRSDNVGPRTFRSLVNRYGGAGAALDALPALIRASGGARKIAIASRDACKREMDAAARMGARLIALGEEGYPSALRMIDAAPPLIAVKGAVAAAAKPCVAMVGSRNASASGLTLTAQIARELASDGFVIVSGLARGIDQQAHRAALQTGTIAVLAGGLDKVYPPEHEALADAICEHGMLISEMPVGWTPRGRDFPRRNRIVSGIALGTVVIEAARRSGSLITARFAIEQGREVFAAPGSPLDPRAEGTNDLLRQGATFCTCAGDVAQALAPLLDGTSVPPPPMRESEHGEGQSEPLWDETDLFGAVETPQALAGYAFNEGARAASDVRDAAASAPAQDMSAELSARIAALLSPSPVAIDELIRAAGLSAAEVHLALVELELSGQAVRHAGGLVSR